MHSFIHVSGDTVFSKRGYQPQDPFLLESLTSLLKEFRVDTLAARCHRATRKTEYCRYWVSYFRCQSLASYIAAKSIVVSAELRELEEKLALLEARISEIAMAGSRFKDDREKESLSEQLEEATARLALARRSRSSQ